MNKKKFKIKNMCNPLNKKEINQLRHQPKCVFEQTITQSDIDKNRLVLNPVDTTDCNANPYINCNCCVQFISNLNRTYSSIIKLNPTIHDLPFLEFDLWITLGDVNTDEEKKTNNFFEINDLQAGQKIKLSVVKFIETEKMVNLIVEKY